MRKMKKLKDINKQVLIINTILFILAIVLFIVRTVVDKNITPYPEKTQFNELDERMIALGEARSLAILLVLGILFYTAIIGDIIASMCCLYIAYIKQLWINNSVSLNYFGTATRINYNSSWYKVWRIVKIILVTITYLLLQFLFLPIMWYSYSKTKLLHLPGNLSKLVCINFGVTSKKSKITKTLLTLFPITLFATLGIVSTGMTIDSHTNWIKDEAAYKHVQLSNNHQNVIQLYFDRANGLSWNLILLVDQIVNKDKSFINEFPEFVSYLNTVSLSAVTKISNPTIYAGPAYDPFIMQSSKSNVFSDKPNQEINEDDWYFASLKTQAQMFMNNGVNNIHLNNLPYFGKMYMSHDGIFGDMDTLQERFDEVKMDNVNAVTNAKLCQTLDNYKVKVIEHEGYYDAHATKNWSKWTKFINTDSGTFMANFSQQCHQPYIFAEHNRYKHSKNHNDFFRAMYTTIKDIQLFFNRLKEEPFYDNSGNKIGNVYDHTLIIINSDHGYGVNTDLCKEGFAELTNYLKARNVLSDDQYQQIWKFKYYDYNPVIQVKPFKFNKDNKVIDLSTSHFEFNSDQLVSISDLPFIIQNQLSSYNSTSTKSYFGGVDVVDKISDITTRNIVSNMILLNPLDTSSNSFTNKVLKNRKFYLFDPNNWRYFWNQNTFDVSSSYKVTDFSKSSSIFDNASWEAKKA